MKLQILCALQSFLQGEFSPFRINDIHSGKPCFYGILKDNFSKIDIEVEILKFEEIDKSKPWIIDVFFQAWNFYKKSEDVDIPDLLDFFTPEIRHELLHGSAFLLINHSSESHTLPFFENLYRYLDHTKLHPSKIIYMCNSYEVDRHYDDFVKIQNIPENNRIITMFSPHAFNFINEGDIRFFTYDRNKGKDKIYLCLNRVDREHRVMMVSMLSYFDLLRFGYVSLSKDPNFQAITHCPQLYKDHRLIEGYEKIRDELPLTVDTTDFVTNHVGYSSLSMEFYQKTYFSLVSSTFALQEQEVSVATNEKELKPILAKHPFIIFGRPKTLEYMRNMGFMTFSKWFDEKYDQEMDDLKRIEMIALEVQRLSQLKESQWKIILQEMEPVLMHNYNRLVNYISERCYFSSGLKKLLFFVY